MNKKKTEKKIKKKKKKKCINPESKRGPHDHKSCIWLINKLRDYYRNKE